MHVPRKFAPRLRKIAESWLGDPSILEEVAVEPTPHDVFLEALDDNHPRTREDAVQSLKGMTPSGDWTPIKNMLRLLRDEDLPALRATESPSKGLEDRGVPQVPKAPSQALSGLLRASQRKLGEFSVGDTVLTGLGAEGVVTRTDNPPEPGMVEVDVDVEGFWKGKNWFHSEYLTPVDTALDPSTPAPSENITLPPSDPIYISDKFFVTPDGQFFRWDSEGSDEFGLHDQMYVYLTTGEEADEDRQEAYYRGEIDRSPELLQSGWMIGTYPFKEGWLGGVVNGQITPQQLEVFKDLVMRFSDPEAEEYQAFVETYQDEGGPVVYLEDQGGYVLDWVTSSEARQYFTGTETPEDPSPGVSGAYSGFQRVMGGLYEQNGVAVFKDDPWNGLTDSAWIDPTGNVYHWDSASATTHGGVFHYFRTGNREPSTYWDETGDWVTDNHQEFTDAIDQGWVSVVFEEDRSATIVGGRATEAQINAIQKVVDVARELGIEDVDIEVEEFDEEGGGFKEADFNASGLPKESPHKIRRKEKKKRKRKKRHRGTPGWYGPQWAGTINPDAVATPGESHNGGGTTMPSGGGDSSGGGSMVAKFAMIDGMSDRPVPGDHKFIFLPHEEVFWPVTDWDAFPTHRDVSLEIDPEMQFQDEALFGRYYADEGFVETYTMSLDNDPEDVDRVRAFYPGVPIEWNGVDLEDRSVEGSWWKTAVDFGMTFPDGTPLLEAPPTDVEDSVGFWWFTDGTEIYWDYRAPDRMHGDAIAALEGDVSLDGGTAGQKDYYRLRKQKMNPEDEGYEAYWGNFWTGPQEIDLNSIGLSLPDELIQRGFDLFPDAQKIRFYDGRSLQEIWLRFRPWEYEMSIGQGYDPNIPLHFQMNKDAKLAQMDEWPFELGETVEIDAQGGDWYLDQWSGRQGQVVDFSNRHGEPRIVVELDDGHRLYFSEDHIHHLASVEPNLEPQTFTDVDISLIDRFMAMEEPANSSTGHSIKMKTDGGTGWEQVSEMSPDQEARLIQQGDVGEIIKDFGTGVYMVYIPGRNGDNPFFANGDEMEFVDPLEEMYKNSWWKGAMNYGDFIHQQYEKTDDPYSVPGSSTAFAIDENGEVAIGESGYTHSDASAELESDAALQVKGLIQYDLETYDDYMFFFPGYVSGDLIHPSGILTGHIQPMIQIIRDNPVSEVSIEFPDYEFEGTSEEAIVWLSDLWTEDYPSDFIGEDDLEDMRMVEWNKKWDARPNPTYNRGDEVLLLSCEDKPELQGERASITNASSYHEDVGMYDYIVSTSRGYVAVVMEDEIQPYIKTSASVLDDIANEDWGEEEVDPDEKRRQRYEDQILRGLDTQERNELYRVIMEAGGIQTRDDLREEYRGIPNTFKRKDGMPGDEMAEYLSTYYPELGIDEERDLIDALSERYRAASWWKSAVGVNDEGLMTFNREDLGSSHNFLISPEGDIHAWAKGDKGYGEALIALEGEGNRFDELDTDLATDWTLNKGKETYDIYRGEGWASGNTSGGGFLIVTAPSGLNPEQCGALADILAEESYTTLVIHESGKRNFFRDPFQAIDYLTEREEAPV